MLSKAPGTSQNQTFLGVGVDISTNVQRINSAATAAVVQKGLCGTHGLVGNNGKCWWVGCSRGALGSATHPVRIAAEKLYDLATHPATQAGRRQCLCVHKQYTIYMADVGQQWGGVQHMAVIGHMLCMCACPAE